MRLAFSFFFVFLFAVSSLCAIEPSNPKLSKVAREVLHYIQEEPFMLAGAHLAKGPRSGNDDLAYIVKTTGKSPAVIGLDVGIYAKRRSDAYYNKLNKVFLDTRDFWREGHIITYSWHWGNPLIEQNSYKNTKVKFDIKKALAEGTAEHKAMMQDLDDIAAHLKQLQEKNIPILWRPLHEMCGTWFWWGKEGKEPFQTLWKFIYNYYTNHHNLNNLIWVYSASQKVRTDWYPGHETVDILGVDIYKEELLTDPQVFQHMRELADGRPIALTENALIPMPSALNKANGRLWDWFLTWHTQWLRENSPKRLNTIYNHENVITLDELPKFGNR